MQTACTLSPISGYLKALGVLRIVNAQLDPEARGYWQDGVFHLETHHSPEALAVFFAESYRPTPCISPWNKNSKLWGSVPEAIQSLNGERFAELQQVAAVASKLLPQYVVAGKVADKPKLLEHLSREGTDAYNSWQRINAVVMEDTKGKLVARYPALLGGTAGAFGVVDIGDQFVASLAAAQQQQYQAAVFGSPEPGVVSTAGNSLVFDPAGRGDGQQGYRVATNDTQKSSGNPADLVLLLEGLMLFDGYATTVQSNEDGKGGTKAATFTLAVVHNSSGHASSSWLENDGLLTEELWCPIWEEPVTFSELRDELGQLAQLPLPRQLNTGTDFALFASQLGRRKGLSGFARFCFPPRVGQGTRIPSLIEIFPLAGCDDRTDALAPIAKFAWQLRMRSKEAPASYRHAAGRVVAELEALSGGGGSFAELLRRLVTWRQQDNLQPEDKRIQRFRLPAYKPQLASSWLDHLQREINGPEWRVGLSLATKRPHAFLEDIALILEGRLDLDLINVLRQGISWIDQTELPESSVQAAVPWLASDYLAGVLLNQWWFSPSTPIEGDRKRWRELLEAHRAEEAMAVALQRLRMAEVVSWPWPTITNTEPTRLLVAVQIPLHPKTLGQLIRVS